MELKREEIHARFHQALGRIVCAMSRLDFAVGCWLIALKERGGSDPSALLSSSVSLHERLQALERELHAARTRDQAINEEKMRAWVEKANSVRALRNGYVHARWGVPGASESDDPVLRYLPMHWNWDSTSGTAERQVSVSELTAQAIEVERLADEFHALFKPN